MNLNTFEQQEHFLTGLKTLFADLNVPVNYIDDKPIAPKDILSNTFKAQSEAYQLMEDVFALGMVDQAAFDGKQSDALASIARSKHDYDGILIFGVTLKERENGLLPTRNQLAEITRAFNREFHYTPVVVVFQYRQTPHPRPLPNGEGSLDSPSLSERGQGGEVFLSLASCERMTYAQTWREGEKVGKVSLLKDVNIAQPHAGHLRILDGLRIERSGKQAITTFEALYAYWQEVFSVALLNKRFYQELANWYFWALPQVEFPDDAEKDTEIRNATSVIRLLTRLIFVWFLKEKHLIPEILFDKTALATYLKYDDSTGSTYYKAILQNLFFATLNTEMRKDNPHSRKFVNRQYGVQGFYRYSRFFQEPDKALALFQDIPFLNGGLFENLDRNVGTPEEVRIDCFSERPKNEPRLKVPDVLFFGEESECDFSAIYGDAKRKRERVRGLINILNAYKFTIAENTPIEEEIALDPELLGKVFENLLASYNPETQTTARKQTGSFYTPREIVNYMVDESLIAYLTPFVSVPEVETSVSTPSPFQGGISRQSFAGDESPAYIPAPFQGGSLPRSGNGIQPDVSTSGRLRHLLSYSNEPHQFTDAEVTTLINALHAAKILDPACGSGAFPMGMLHKMVHILTKLDPENVRWRETQRQKAIKETEQAFQMGDKEERDKRLLEINEVFEDNASDYGRKLYLIENGIYGVDIQPIAVQIAKLRCFISLIVDQQVNPAKKNLGLLPLPNLETKFVAANTLIGIDKPEQMLLRNPEIDRKEAELRRVRQKHFDARTPQTKAKYRSEDERLRHELADLLKKDGFPADTTERLAHWNPYDQNAKADFFDQEWMFGMQDGFDIVIGNPPYVSLSKVQKKEHFIRFKTYENSSDLYCLFYESSNEFLRKNGILCLITSNQWLQTNYGKRLRNYFVHHLNPLKLLNFGGFRVFESATVDTNVFISIKENNQNQLWACYFKTDYQPEIPLRDYFEKNKILLTNLEHEKWTIADNVVILLKEKLKQKGVLLKNWNIKINYGIKTGLNEAFIIDTVQKDELCAKDKQCAEIMRPVLRGRDVHKYSADWAGLWLITTKNGLDIPHTYKTIYEHLQGFGDQIKNRADQGENWWNLRACAYYDDFEKEKIIYPETTVRRSEFYLDRKQFYIDKTCFMITGESLPYLNAILSSRLMEWYLETELRLLGKKSIQYSKQYIENVPIPRISGQEQQPFEALVDQILAAKQRDPAADTRTLEAEIDRRVSALYGLTPEEIAIVEGKA